MPAPPNRRTAVYAGVFDPIHYGHIDIIQRGSRMFDHLVVGVGINPDKKSFFTPEERLEMVHEVVKQFSNVDVKLMTGLTVRFVREVNARVMIRGLRTLSDMEYEFTMSLMNGSLDPDLETIFLLAKEGFSHISSSLIRQIGAFQGDLEKFVPLAVKKALEARGGDPPIGQSFGRDD